MHVYSTSRNLGTAAICAMAALAAQAEAGDYLQPPLFGDGNSYPSELNGAHQAESWQADASLSVVGLRWWGATSGGSASSFTVRIFGDSAGSPGSLLNQFDIGTSFSQTFTGMSDLNGRDVFEYQATLGSGWAVTSGATYWINIMNDQSVGGGPTWLWHQGSGGNGSHAFRFGESWNIIDGDLAFQLIVPGPSALMLLVSWISFRRRRCP